MGLAYMDEQRTKKQSTTNVRNVHTANAQRIHRILINTLSLAQNLEHVENVPRPQRTNTNR